MIDFPKRILVGAMAGALACLLLLVAYDYVPLGLVYAAIALGFHALGVLVRARRGRTP